VLCEELWHVYTSLSQGRAAGLAPLTSTFRDYADLVHQQRASEDFEADVAHWSQRLAAGAPSGILPYDGNATEPPAAALTGSTVGSVPAPDLIAAKLTDVIANMRGWAVAARMAADAFERADSRSADRFPRR